MPLHLRETDVRELLSPADAVAAVEASFARRGAGALESGPRTSLALADGSLDVAAAVDAELGVGGVRSTMLVEGRSADVLLLFSAVDGGLLAVAEAAALGSLAAGAVTAVAARHLARPDARSLGVIGAGRRAESQIACLRVVLPQLEDVVVFARDRARLERFCARVGAVPAGYNRDAAEQDVVVTATTSPDPVLRGEWLRPGALVCAAGADRLEARELDNAAVERATFVCCNSIAQARLQAGDLVEPVARGVLDWLEVHELADVVSGTVRGRARETDIVLLKSLRGAGEELAVAAGVLERARAAGLGVEL